MDAKLARATWMSIDEAARLIGVVTITLRRGIERNARRRADGSVEARFDGITARKCGRLWRVALDPAWTKPMATGT